VKIVNHETKPELNKIIPRQEEKKSWKRQRKKIWIKIKDRRPGEEAHS
jgi:hypothetical protein